MNQELIRLIAMDIARGMTLLHTKQIIHRDLKAGNILVYHLEEELSSIVTHIPV